MKISVIIPCYNCSKTIENTLNSIFNQTYRDFEIIAVDDGSKDNTREILNKYKSRIKYIYQENAGVSSARNTGVRNAQGEWIAFCDSDDLWVPEKLEIMAEIIDNSLNNWSLLFSDFSIMYGTKTVAECAMRLAHSFFPIFKEYNLTVEELFPCNQRITPKTSFGGLQECSIHYGNVFRWLILGNFILPSTALVRRKNYIQENGFNKEFRNAEDTEFFLRFGKRNNFLYIDLPLVGYRRTETSLLSTSMLKTIQNGIRAVEMHCKEDKETYKRYKNIVDTSLARKYSKLGYYYLSELKKRDGLKSSLKSLKYNKFEKLAWMVLLGSMIPTIVLKMIRNMVEIKKRC